MNIERCWEMLFGGSLRWVTSNQQVNVIWWNIMQNHSNQCISKWCDVYQHNNHRFSNRCWCISTLVLCSFSDFPYFWAWEPVPGPSMAAFVRPRYGLQPFLGPRPTSWTQECQSIWTYFQWILTLCDLSLWQTIYPSPFPVSSLALSAVAVSITKL